MDKVITISREFGSGGREIGVLLAEKLGIPFYDKEVISMAAEDSNISEAVFKTYGESISEVTVKMNYHTFSPVYEIPMSDQLFVAQSKIITNLAEQGPCVIVGRCADKILSGSIDIFIHAKMKKRVERIVSLQTGVAEEEIEARIREIDNKRKDYYQYYTGSIWGRAQNYQISLDSGITGTEGCVEAILTYMKYL